MLGTIQETAQDFIKQAKNGLFMCRKQHEQYAADNSLRMFIGVPIPIGNWFSAIYGLPRDIDE
jgi:hypothetical protein